MKESDTLRGMVLVTPELGGIQSIKIKTKLYKTLHFHKIMKNLREEKSTMIKLKVSYERPEELKGLIKLLEPRITSYKLAAVQKGQYKRAYITLQLNE